MAVNDAWLDARIASTQRQIEAYESCLEALNAGTYSYSLDTGQGRQTVTRNEIGRLQATYDQLLIRYQSLCNTRDGSAITVVNPAW